MVVALLAVVAVAGCTEQTDLPGGDVPSSSNGATIAPKGTASPELEGSAQASTSPGSEQSGTASAAASGGSPAAEGLVAVDVCSAVPVDVAEAAALAPVTGCREVDPAGPGRGATVELAGADGPGRQTAGRSLTVRTLAEGGTLLQRLREGSPSPRDVPGLGEEALAVPPAGGRETLVASRGGSVVVVEHYASDPTAPTPGAPALADVARAVLDAAGSPDGGQAAPR